MRIVFLGGNVSAELVTGFVAAIGCMTASVLKKPTILLQTIERNKSGEFGNYFASDVAETAVKEELGRYMVGGAEYLIRKRRTLPLGEREVQNVLEPLIPGYLSYLPSELNSEQFTLEELCATFRELALLCEELADLVLVDGGCMKEADFLQIEGADRVVILLDNEFPGLFRSLESTYLLCNYRAESVYNMKNIMRMFDIKEDYICPISSSMQFLSSLKQGELRRFLGKGRISSHFPNTEEGLFYRSLQQAVEKLLREEPENE